MAKDGALHGYCSKDILVQLVDVTCRAEAGPGLTRICQLRADGAEDFLDTVVLQDLLLSPKKYNEQRSNYHTSISLSISELTR